MPGRFPHRREETRGPAVHRLALRTVVLGLGLGPRLIGCSSIGHSTPSDSQHDGLVAELGRASVERSIEPRLSIPIVYRPCASAVPAGGTVARADCGGTVAGHPASTVLVDLARRASARVHAEADPSALHAAALLDLLWAQDQRIPIERSVAYLRAASRLADRPAPALADLAAALLVRAEHDQTPRDLLEAIETADRALRLEPRDPVARFNLALGLDLLGLDGQAEAAWKAYLEIDSVSDWAAEARRRTRRPPETGIPTAPAPGAPPSEITAYVAAGPREALLLGWDRLLDEWGAGVIAGDTGRATRWLNLAWAVGNGLAERGGDATLADAVSAINGVAGDPAAVRALAQAHREYAAGRAAYRTGRYGAARRSLQRVIAAHGVPPALLAWARVTLASILVYDGRPQAAEAAVRLVAAYADTLRQPALAGQARWVLGTTLLRRGRYEQAIRAFRPAAALFDRAGERENLGAVQHLLADTQQYFGDPAVEYPAMQRALMTLRPYRRSVWLHSLLYFAARFAAGDGFPRAAARIQDEDVRIAAEMGQRIYLAEARIAQGRLLAAAGDRAAARENLASSRAIVEALEPGPERRWFEADLRLAEAGISPSSEAARTIPALDSVVAFFSAQHNVIRLLPALVARSEAALTAGRVADATADLDRVLDLLDAQSARTTNLDLRASLLDAARHVVDRLVMLRLASGAPAAALADLERARVSLAPVGAAPVPKTRPRPTAPAGQVVVDYALIGDTLLAWTLADTSLMLTRTTLDRDSLVHTIKRVRSSLELRVDDPATLSDLGRLYDWLVRPIEPRLGAEGVPLVLIADGDVAGVPFPALRDAGHDRYLIERHALRFGVSLRDAARPPDRAPPPAPRALLVADPAFDVRVFPRLAPLPGAMAEVEAVAAQYPHARVLTGAAASRPAVEAALRGADILHYAGHAVFDDVRPEQSSLVLAPDSAAETSGRLTAAEIERLQLRGLRLVVLSACETTRPRGGRSAGFAGLAGSLLAAGAGGVLGTLWRVDDGLTLQLMPEFHRAYRQSGDAARSLREAQLRLLRSSDATLRSPVAWAAFRYTGN
jgi:CHAT domain-containing protein/tetratricopeptide (TPR) repeat protein